jgi:hypothetical protein
MSVKLMKFYVTRSDLQGRYSCNHIVAIHINDSYQVAHQQLWRN